MTIQSVKNSLLASALCGALLLLSSACAKKSSKDDTPAAQATPTPTGIQPTPTARPQGFPQIEGQQAADRAATLTNLDELIDAVNLRSYHGQGYHAQNFKIAVLDNGFAGVAESLGKRLPPTTRVIDGPGNPQQETPHGTMLAELIYAITTGKTSYLASLQGPEMLLIGTNGYTNFVAAIDKAIAERVDMILYSQVWEYGGNFNGTGFINEQVKRATDAGILWINAAGNFGRSTFQGPVITLSGHTVLLPHQGKYVRFRIARPAANANIPAGTKIPIKMVLAWNDFANSKDYRTPQDLDLILEDQSGTELSAGRMIQDGRDHGVDGRYSAHAREIVRAELAPGDYQVRIDAMSRNFDSASLLRLAIDGLGVEVLDHPALDTVLIPADNPTVLTVGASDVTYSAENSSGAVDVRKPEFLAVSKLKYDNGQTIDGTSSAAAVAAATLAVFQSANGKGDRRSVLQDLDEGLLAAPFRASRHRLSCRTSSVSVVVECGNHFGRIRPILHLVDAENLYR